MVPPFKPNLTSDTDTSHFDVIKDDKKNNFANDKLWDGKMSDWDAVF